ncbi:MAG: epoxyqueuosine reductase QueH [Bdellovibrionota bacterium]
MKSYRVFLWPKLDGSSDLFAIAQNTKIWDLGAFENSEFFWIPGSKDRSARELLAILEWVLPQKHAVHVFASPEISTLTVSLSIGTKKLLPISRESGLKDYIFIEKFLAAPPFPPATAEQLLLQAIARMSDRVLEDRFRICVDLPGIRNALDPARYARLREKSRLPQKLLLHVCCGPDAAGVVRQLKSEFDLSCFWYDPNIQPKQEHDKRLEAFVKVMELEGIPYSIGEYDVDAFLEKIKGLEHTPEQGAKCSKCYDMRLERSAFEAREKGFDLYATTLAISPHKVQQKLIAFGELGEKRYGVPYFHRNFMKDDGFNDSVEYTRTHNIYRQDYCGCWFSLHEGGTAAKGFASDLGLHALSKTAPAACSDAQFEAYEARLRETPASDYAGG